MKPWLLLDCCQEADGGAPSFLPHIRPRPVQVCMVWREALPTDASAFRGMVITGSSASVCTDPPAWVEPLVGLVRQGVRLGSPIFGTCFGHQVLAEAAAGPGAVRRRARAEVGWPELDLHTPDPLLAGVPRPIRVFVTHEDEVADGLPGLQIIASTPECPTHMVRVPGKPQWGVQFHTEFTPQEEAHLVRWRAERHPELGLDVDGLLSTAVDSAPLLRALFTAFFQEAEKA